MTLRAPFPWFGGKSRAASLIWPRFGNVPNYVEPFAGGLSVLLARPWPGRVETVNDVDAYLSNFWRAVSADPDGVAHHADWPVNEADLHARHRWLVETGVERIKAITTDPEFFDAKVAGWWVWGQCLWIGSGWCARPEWTGRATAGRAARGIHTDEYAQRPDLTSAGRGMLAPEFSRMGDTVNQRRRPQLSNANGVIAKDSDRWQKRPCLHARGERGVIRRPNMGGAGGGQGVHAPRLHNQIPQLSGDGSGAQRKAVGADGLVGYMRTLQARLRRVRVCCGDWTRVLTPAVTIYIGVTGVLLDPPYSHAERSICYSHDADISGAVREWAIAHGDDPKLRIALCGYEGEHDMPASWDCVPWTAGGGYGRSVRGKANRHRERLWFSPHCLSVGLFADGAA